MSERVEPKPEATDTRLVEEMASIPDEPLLPIEKKLIAWSLILGVSLLAILAWLSSTLFPVSGEWTR